MSMSGTMPGAMPGAAATLAPGTFPGAGARFGWVRGPSELSFRDCVTYAVTWQVLSFALICAQILLLCEFGVLTLLLGMIGLVALYLRKPLAAATVFLQVLLYQNWFLSIFSVIGMDRLAFQVVQGTAFAAAGCMAAIAVLRMLALPDRKDPTVRLTRWTCLTLAVVVLYTAYGVHGSSVPSALAYFRNTSAMLLMLLVGLDLGRSWGYRTLASIFMISVVFGVFIAMAELVVPHAYYTAVNALPFINQKTAAGGGIDVAYSVDEIVASRIVTWFNITGGDASMISVRVGGPNMHPISYAYVIAVTGILAATTRRFVVLGLCLAFLMMAGIKGPLLMLLFSTALFAVWWITRQRSLLLLASVVSLAAYIGAGIAFGVSRGDFHVLGFLGGVHSLLTMPQGHGIGVGGNLSAIAGEGLDWREWQKTGVDFALESAVGVLFYQMGAAAIVVLAPAISLVNQSFRNRSVRRPGRGPRMRMPSIRPTLMDALFIGIAVTLANGVFQEEAYSPYGLGLLTLFGAIAVSNRVNANRLRSA